jgi:hypothetical protein
LVGRQPFHARFIAQDTAFAQGTAGVYGQYGYQMALCSQEAAQGFNEGAFSGTRSTTDTNPYSFCRQSVCVAGGFQSGNDSPGQRYVFCSGAFQQGDGPAQGSAVACPNGGNEAVSGR